MAALTSAFPSLHEYRVALALGILLVITLANLRGLRESGTVMAIPVYLFLGCYLLMIGYGLVRAAIDGPGSLATTAPPATMPLTAVLLLHTFATGCTALTGVEAISNGVPSFKKPSTRNAQQTLIVMAILMGILFAGTVGLTQYFAVIPSGHETILSALARHLLGSGPAYMLVQISTLLILAVAAKTSFAGFPRLASVLARDRYMPNQFAHLGDRLVFSNGVVVLALLTAVLIVVFAGDSHALIPLFAVGVFLAFTLSQAGMVVHWVKLRGRSWQFKAFINGLGALVTAVALVVVAYSKFSSGAWIVLVLLPTLVFIFQRVHFHYLDVSRELALRGTPSAVKPMPDPRIVIPVSDIHRGVVAALRYARSISSDVTGVYVETNPDDTAEFLQKWNAWGQGIPLVVVLSPYRSIIGPLLDFLDETDKQHKDGQLASVIIPEFVPERWWQHLLHNQTAAMLKLAILYHRRKSGYNRAIIDVPFYLRD